MTLDSRGNKPVFQGESKMGLHHVILTTSRTPSEKLRLIQFETHQLPNIEESDNQEEIFYLYWTIYICRRKLRENFNTILDKLNLVAYHYRNY